MPICKRRIGESCLDVFGCVMLADGLVPIVLVRKRKSECCV